MIEDIKVLIERCSEELSEREYGFKYSRQLASEWSRFEQWLADHDAGGCTADQVAPNGRSYWDNYIADIDPDHAFLTIELDVSSYTFTIPAATPNRIYTLLWTTDLSSGEWTELPLGVGNPSTANPLPIVDAASLFVCVRVELPGLR